MVVETQRRIELAAIQTKAAEATRKADELGVIFDGLTSFVDEQQKKATLGIARLQQSQADLDAAIKVAVNEANDTARA